MFSDTLKITCQFFGNYSLRSPVIIVCVRQTHECKFKSREEARHLIFEYIEVFYNRVRIHSANDYLSPVEYELLGSLQQAA